MELLNRPSRIWKIILLLIAVFVISGTAGSSSATSGLVAEWNFDGNAQDSSGNGNHGTISGARFVDGIKGQALEFDGMDNYFSAPVTGTLNSIKSQGTISAWINFKDNFLIKEAGDSCSNNSRALTIWRFGMYAMKSGAEIDCQGRVISDWRIDDSHVGQVAGQIMRNGMWYHVALVYSGEDITLFINGQKVNSSRMSGVLNNSDGRFWLGKNGNAFFPMFYHGIIDEVKLYNRALSADEIQAYYDAFTASNTVKAAPYPVNTVEKYDYVTRSETITNDLLANKAVEYNFYYPEHGIYEIAVTSNENEHSVPIKVEALDGTPVLVTKPPTGKLYRSLNITASTKNIRDARIRFKVKNSWIESSGVDYHDIRMLRWNGENWVQLDTSKKSIDSDYSYYEAKTYGFSTFAITGIKSEVQTAIKANPVENPKTQDNSWLGYIILIILIVALARYINKHNILKNIKSLAGAIAAVIGAIIAAVIATAVMVVPRHDEPTQKDLSITSAFGYRGATILYKIKVENISSTPIADIRINLFVPNVFLLLEKEKSLALLKSGESKTVTFEIRPTGECGDCEVSGKVTYYDTGHNKTKEMDLESKMLSIVCPMLKVKEINESEWHSIVSNLIETEEGTKEIDMPAETLFTMSSRIIKDMHMHMLRPEITQSQQLFNGVARFFGEGVKGLKYAALVEVVGGPRKAKLILRAWAEKEDALTGFYHGILDEIEKRINVKGYIDEPIVQHFNIAGHYVTGQVGKIIDAGDKSINRS